MIEAVARELANREIPAMLVGAFASSYHGISRSTEDADFLIQIETFPNPNKSLAESLGPDFIVDPQAPLETFTMGTYFTPHT